MIAAMIINKIYKNYENIISSIFIDLPKSAAFDTYSLAQNLQAEIKSIE